MVELLLVMIDVVDSEVVSVLLANADKTEEQARPAAESLAAIRRAGALALRTPVSQGGSWADAEIIARRLTELGQACPATAWVAGTCMTSKNIVAATFGQTVLERAFADPDALGCGSGNPAGRGERRADEVRISGRWPNVSGCEDADWAALGLIVDGAFSWAFFPITDLTIDRDWRMAGMRGTGSHTLVAEDLVVPADRVAPSVPFTPNDLLLYGISVLGPVLGAARAALGVIDAMFASTRKPFMTAYTRMGDSPGARHWLAEAAHLVERAERTMLAVAHAADPARTIDSHRAQLHMDLADAARDCRSAMEKLLDLHGASGFNTANPLQRYWRDISVGSRHPHLNPYLALERLGLALVSPTED
jgi:alkylation response protein AidB-like acyl-CoA dehydrogenase